MNRRGFLGAIAGLLASPVLAKIPFVQKYIEYEMPGHMLDAYSFVPSIWSAKIAEQFYSSSILATLGDQLTNDAAEKLKITIDDEVFKSMYEEVTPV